MGKSPLISWTDNTRLKINKRGEVHLQSLLLFLRFESIVSLSTTGCRRRLDIAQCSDTGRNEKSLKKNLTQDTREREANNSRKMTIAQIVDTEKPPPPPHHRVVCAMWNLLNLAQKCCCRAQQMMKKHIHSPCDKEKQRLTSFARLENFRHKYGLWTAEKNTINVLESIFHDKLRFTRALSEVLFISLPCNRFSPLRLHVWA